MPSVGSARSRSSSGRKKKPWRCIGCAHFVSFFTVQICVSPTFARNGVAFQNGTPFTWNSDRPSGPAGGSVRDEVDAGRSREARRRDVPMQCGHGLSRQRRLVAEGNRQHIFGNAKFDAAVAAVVQVGAQA